MKIGISNVSDKIFLKNSSFYTPVYSKSHQMSSCVYSRSPPNNSKRLANNFVILRQLDSKKTQSHFQDSIVDQRYAIPHCQMSHPNSARGLLDDRFGNIESQEVENQSEQRDSKSTGVYYFDILGGTFHSSEKEIGRLDGRKYHRIVRKIRHLF